MLQGKHLKNFHKMSISNVLLFWYHLIYRGCIHHFIFIQNIFTQLYCYKSTIVSHVVCFHEIKHISQGNRMENRQQGLFLQNQVLYFSSGNSPILKVLSHGFRMRKTDNQCFFKIYPKRGKQQRTNGLLMRVQSGLRGGNPLIPVASNREVGPRV